MENNHDQHKVQDPYKVHDPYKQSNDPYARRDEQKTKSKRKGSNLFTLVILAALLGAFLALRF